MALDIDCQPDSRDSPIRADQECTALGYDAENGSGTEVSYDLHRGVWNHWEGQRELVDEQPLLLGVVCTHAHHEGVQRFQFGQVRLEVAGLVTSTRRVCSHIEEDDHPSATLI